MSGIITLKAKRDKALLRRHPWIFSNGIHKVSGKPLSGETVEVYSAEGKYLATAAYSPESQIRARVWSFDQQQEIDKQFFIERLEDAQAARQILSEFADTNAYRLVAGENDGLPGITIDRYANVLVLQLLSAGAEFQRANLIEALKHCFPDDVIYERSDVDVRKKEGLAPQQGLIHGELPAQPMEIKENGLRLLINVETGHKTGYYLDQRNNRKLVGQLAKGKKILNCFCYTGGFGTYALAGGAKKVVNVDVSDAALEIAAKNVELNNLDASKITQLNADVFKQLRAYRDCDEQFDMIVLDPPKFVDSKASLNRASRGYKDINMLAMQMLRPGGILLTYSCSGLMPTSLFQKIVADAAIDAKRDMQFLKTLEQAEDHPVGGPYPEGHYLKGFLCRVK
ncbi:class I SAM-dependent methyltransferase [Agarivorans litoreus]|uniref:class I SAM-dependent methyltransferase n=1 Tax=Agarivorans litoreus TaxID=1510455 RepID=UPI001C7D67FC|nr:class I SAM-dependent methyltransferase [Agarivorans litoreus]